MDSEEIFKFCLENGLLVDKEVLKLFSESGDIESAKLIIRKIKNHTQQKIITKNLFYENKDKVNQFFDDLPEENRKGLEKLKIKLGLSIEISREISTTEIKKDVQENIDGSVRITTMNQSFSKKIEVSDFVKYFRGRLNEMKSYLQENSQLDGLTSINKISGEKQNFSIIGLVYEKRITKNKNILLDIEDLTGRVKVLISQNKEDLYKKAEDITLDAVLGFKGSGNREIIFANEIVFPDSIIQERKKSPFEEYALFTGDLHIGSKLFMKENFLKFIDYLNGKILDTPEVSKIKYLFIVGDLIAGVGIYPGQEEDLEFPDIERQFEEAARILSKIRKDIKIIISPGNHDALRIMEPQPLFDEKYAWPLYELENVVLTGNPVSVNIGARKGFNGFNVLTYHGYSYHYYANVIPKLIIEKSVHTPEKIMAYLLKYRHLAPTHSSTLYFPSEEDQFIIRDIPDIFVSGHTHKSAVTYYNNILIISSSSWESLTPFQEKMGNQPDFCKVPMFNLKTRGIKVLDFEGE
ncbi:MAG: metallophosphoesterase [Candidatus Pacearchaeota archaeon]